MDNGNMSKNLIPEIAKLLGVNINQEFYIKTKHNCHYSKYRFTDDNIEIYDNLLHLWRCGSFVLPLLILGEYTIKENNDIEGENDE